MNRPSLPRTLLARSTAALFAFGVVLSLTGCGTAPAKAPAGSSTEAGAPVFPDPDSAWIVEGTFPRVESLRLIGNDTTKDQLYDLLGHPHFREGMMNVGIWDYLFRFRTPQGVRICQYQVHFSDARHVSATYWKPQDCADLLRPAVVVAAPAPDVQPPPPPPPMRAEAPRPRRFSFSADALFAFGRSDLASLAPEGRRQLDAVVNELRNVTGRASVRITGHADRIGNAASNQRLSQARAEAVRDYLVRQGVPAESIVATGRGSTEPQVSCDQRDRKALVECLAPNRRVEIEAAGG